MANKKAKKAAKIAQQAKWEDSDTDQQFRPVNGLEKGLENGSDYDNDNDWWNPPMKEKRRKRVRKANAWAEFEREEDSGKNEMRNDRIRGSESTSTDDRAALTTVGKRPRNISNKAGNAVLDAANTPFLRMRNPSPSPAMSRNKPYLNGMNDSYNGYGTPQAYKSDESNRLLPKHEFIEQQSFYAQNRLQAAIGQPRAFNIVARHTTISRDQTMSDEDQVACKLRSALHKNTNLQM